MAYSPDVKELAYTLDPACWVSYSGKTPGFKAVMDGRRTASIKLAERQLERAVRRAPEILPPETVAWSFIDQHQASPALHEALVDLIRRARVDGSTML